MNMIDVFAGLGGQSEGFLINGWNVRRIDNNMLLQNIPNMTIQDAQEFLEECKVMVDAFGIPKLDYIHFSPPCLEFSNAFSSPKIKAKNAGLIHKPNMELVHICVEIVKLLKPRFWSIENVVGAIEYFEPILGPYRQRINSYVYWGNFPYVIMPPDWKYEKKNSYDPGPSNPLRANYRALIPLQISEAFREAIECQTQLSEWI